MPEHPLTGRTPAATLIHIVSGPGCGKWTSDAQGSGANLLSKFNYEKL